MGMMRCPWLTAVRWWVVSAGCLAGVRPSLPQAPDSRPSPGRWLLLDFGVGLGEGRHRLSLTQQPGSRVVAEVLPPGHAGPGTASLFEVFSKGHASVRRLPALGREDEAAPLCRVRVADQAPGPMSPRAHVEGLWRVTSRGPNGSVHRLAWEWWSDGRELAGRFDPNTDFRFAHILRGTNDGARVAFAVEYIQDRYDLTGHATTNGWAGTWTKRGENEAGTWTATTTSEDVQARSGEVGVGEPASLRSWRRRGDGAFWVGLGAQRPGGDEWEDLGELGRAWPWRGQGTATEGTRAKD